MWGLICSSVFLLGLLLVTVWSVLIVAGQKDCVPDDGGERWR